MSYNYDNKCVPECLSWPLSYVVDILGYELYAHENTMSLGYIDELTTGNLTWVYQVSLNVRDVNRTYQCVTIWPLKLKWKTVIFHVHLTRLLVSVYVFFTGGNGYNWENPFDKTVEIPPKELFIRWMQVSAYLPSMQFSFTPWQYDQETIDIGLEMVRQHEQRVTPVIINAAQFMIKSGKPTKRWRGNGLQL